MIANAIADEIAERETSAHALAKAAGVNPCVVQRFMTGARADMRMSTASLLCSALGLRIVPTARRPTIRERSTPIKVPLRNVAPPRNQSGDGLEPKP